MTERARMADKMPARRLADRGGFTYRPKPVKRSTARRRGLLAAALDEYRRGRGVSTLYAALLARSLVDLEPDLVDEFRADIADLDDDGR